MQDLKQKAIQGGFAKLLGQLANFVLRVASLIVLARMLDPHDFGLVAMVTALTGLLNLFRDFGLSTATIQRSEITEEQISALFWINTIIGGVLAALAIAGSHAISHFYNEPKLVWITIALSTCFLFNALGVQHNALLKRQMRFTTLAVIDIGALLVSVVTGVGMAWLGFGYWSLIGMTIALPLANTLLAWAATAWVPGPPRVSAAGIRDMLRFGGTITLNSVVVYCAYNLEKVLLGRYWGAEALGIYGRAYQLINIPTENLNSAVGEVAFSALSRVRDDTARLKSYFLKGYALVVAFTLPITIACGLFADDLVLVLLGQKWMEAAPIFRYLAPTILIYGMINPMWWLLISLGLAARSLKIALVLAPLVMTSYVVGLPYGPIGVAISYSTVMALWLLPHLAWCIRGTPVTLGDIGRAIAPPLVSAAAAAGCSWVVVAGLEPSQPIVRLILGGAMLVLAYLGVLLFVMGQRRFYVDLLKGLAKKRPQDGALA